MATPTTPPIRRSIPTPQAMPRRSVCSTTPSRSASTFCWKCISRLSTPPVSTSRAKMRERATAPASIMSTPPTSHSSITPCPKRPRSMASPSVWRSCLCGISILPRSITRTIWLRIPTATATYPWPFSSTRATTRIPTPSRKCVSMNCCSNSLPPWPTARPTPWPSWPTPPHSSTRPSTSGGQGFTAW